jgi:hypothetical protein
VQGAEKPRPYVTAAQATYLNAVDAENSLSAILGFKAVPNVILVDDASIIRYTNYGGFDIRNQDHRRLVEQFAASPDLAEIERQAIETDGFKSPAALESFQRGLAFYRRGQVQPALAEWRKGIMLEPDNWIIRKQVWAIENPERFYEGAVDYAWQKEQIDHSR